MPRCWQLFAWQKRLVKLTPGLLGFEMQNETEKEVFKKSLFLPFT
jgi:hypothetical protein